MMISNRMHEIEGKRPGLMRGSKSKYGTTSKKDMVIIRRQLWSAMC